MKVAIACPGVGRIRRGFEVFADDLFRHLVAEGDHDMVLFKGGGRPAPSEFVLWNIPRGSPLWQLSGGLVKPYIGEELTFALSLARQLKKGLFDIVHVSDCQVASLVAHLTHGRLGRPRIIYSNGGPHRPDDYFRFDFVQQVNPVEMDHAITFGVDPGRMMLVPYAVDVHKFRPSRGTRLRTDLGIPKDAFVVLSVGSHGAHKRLDFLVRELAGIRRDIHLLIVGQPSSGDKPLKQIADRALGTQVHFASLPYEQMPGIYGIADVYVHGALSEGFGLAMLEAMACGLAVVHHDEPGMNWLVGDGGVAVDMTDGTLLAETLRSLVADPGLLRGLSQQALSRSQAFSWEALLPSYLRMYERAVHIPPSD